MEYPMECYRILYTMPTIHIYIYTHTVCYIDYHEEYVIEYLAEYPMYVIPHIYLIIYTHMKFGAIEPQFADLIFGKPSGPIAPSFLKRHPSEKLMLSNRRTLLSVFAMDTTAVRQNHFCSSKPFGKSVAFWRSGRRSDSASSAISETTLFGKFVTFESPVFVVRICNGQHSGSIAPVFRRKRVRRQHIDIQLPDLAFIGQIALQYIPSLLNSISPIEFNRAVGLKLQKTFPGHPQSSMFNPTALLSSIGPIELNRVSGL